MKCPMYLVLVLCLCSIVVCSPVFSAEAPEAKDAEKGAEEKKVEKLPEEVVVGERWRSLLEKPRLESPGLDTSISVVTLEDIRQQDAYSVTEAMKYVPGAMIETRGRKVKEFFSLRGQRYPYPRFSIGGVWQREFEELPYFFSARNFERIEILRSGSALLTGPGGTSGMINLVPRTYEEQETNIYASFGTYNTTKFHINHGGKVNGVSYALGVGNLSTNGPHNKNAAENMTDIYGHLDGSPIEDLELSLDIFGLYGSRELRLAEAPVTGAKFTKDKSSFDPFRSLLTIGKAKYTPNDWASTEVTVNTAIRDHNSIEEIASSGARNTYNEEDYEFGAGIIQTLKPMEKNTLRFGGFYNRWVAPDGKRFYWGNRCDLETISGVIVDEHRFGDLELNAGYRVSRVYINDYGWFNINGSTGDFIGAGGLKPALANPVESEWEKPMHTASAGAAYYLTEQVSLHSNFLFSQVQSRTGTVTATYERPDDETRYQIDVGVKTKKAGLGTATLTGFYVGQEDAIAITGSTITLPSDRIVELYTNRDQEQYGVELDLRSERFESGFQFFTNCVLMDSRKQVDHHMAENEEIPNWIVGAGIIFKKHAFDASVYGKYLSQFKNNRFLGKYYTRLGDIVTADATVGYTLDEEQHYRVFVAGENLTDQEYSTVPGYPDLGIRVFGGVELTF